MSTTSDGINILHHVGLITNCMTATIAAYEKLGFTFAPLTLPKIPIGPSNTPQEIGVGNRCAIFENNYLEVLSVVDSERWAAVSTEQRGPFNIDLPLRRYEGLHVLHLGTTNIDSVRDRLVAAGAKPTSVKPFQRVVDTEEGPQTMRAKSFSFLHGTNPEALMQIAQHETPELVLQPRYMQHANGARSVTEIVICSDDPYGMASKYEFYSGKTASLQHGFYVIDLGLSRVLVVSPSNLNRILPNVAVPALPFLAAFTVAARFDEAERFLEHARVNFSRFDGRLVVDQSEGYGCSVIFERPGESR